MAADRRVRLLAVLAVAVLVTVMVVRSGSDGPPEGAPPAARPNAPGQAAAPADAPPDINLEALALDRRAPNEAGRDPFRFRPQASPPPEAKRIPGIPDDQVGAPPPPPPVPAGPPPPPPITLKFIGVVTKSDGTRIAVLSDGKRPIHGTEGAEIEGRYKILKIGTESIELAYLDGRGRQTIRLTGQ
jgi:hypothetical protein